jgi:alpha-L-fucosidase
VGNNHHRAIVEGEDFQIFENDLPGENKAGLSGQSVSARVPLETCDTMNGMWGYKVNDLNYKSVPTLVRLLVRAASKGANLLINIGPQANGKLPELALDRLRGIGEWMKVYSSTVDGCGVSPVPPQSWGVSTMRPGTIFLHVLDASALPVSDGKAAIVIPAVGKIAAVKSFPEGKALAWKVDKDQFLTVKLPVPDASAMDTVIEISLE